MLTELIGIILIILVMVAVIVRRQMLKTKLGQVEFDDSVDAFQIRLEDAADHIIERMEEHIDQLELLLEEADKKIAILDGRLKELKNLSTRVDSDTTQTFHYVRNEGRGEPEKIALVKESFMLDSGKGIGKEVSGKKKLELKPSKINQAVLEMLNNGHTIDEIAKKTGIGKGAILLIQEMYGSA